MSFVGTIVKTLIIFSSLAHSLSTYGKDYVTNATFRGPAEALEAYLIIRERGKGGWPISPPPAASLYHNDRNQGGMR